MLAQPVPFFSVSIVASLLLNGLAAGQEAGKTPIRTVAPSELMVLQSRRPAMQAWNWREMEQHLEVLRRQRKEWNKSYAELDRSYSFMSGIECTGSKNYAEHLEHLSKWRKELPESYTALVTMAEAYKHYAWEARGKGYADTVTEEGWQLFVERTAEAHRLLDKAIEIGPRDAKVYQLLLNLAFAEGQPREQADRWLEAGIKLDPTYYSLYTTMAVYLMPRWSGEPGDVERFASDMVKKIPGDNGLEAFAQIAMGNFQYESGYGETIYYGQFDRHLLGRALEVAMRRQPANSFIAHFAALCSMISQDHEAAKRIRPLVGTYEGGKDVWLWENSHREFLSWSAATDLPGGEIARFWASSTGSPGIAFGSERNRVWCAQQYGKAAAYLIDVRTGEIALSLPHPQQVLKQFAFDHERNWAVFSHWKGPTDGWTLWDLESGETKFQPTKEMCRALAIHPHLPRIYWAEGRTVRAWDLEADKQVLEVGLPNQVHRIQMSADGKRFVTDLVTPLVCDAESGKVLLNFKDAKTSQGERINCQRVVFADDEGHVWAIAADRSNKVFGLVRVAPDGQSAETLLENIGPGAAWLSPDRRLLAVVPQRTNGAAASPIELWSLATRQVVKRLGGHWNSIDEVAFSPDGSRLASLAVMSDVVKIWSLDDLDGK